MKKKLIIIILAIIILIIILNSDIFHIFCYYVSNFGDVSKKHIEKKYDIEITDISINRNNYFFEGIENDTFREKYVIKVFRKGTFTLYADEGIDKSQAKIIAEENGFPTDTILFLISSSKATDLKEFFYWYFINDEGKCLYIKFNNGEVKYIEPHDY